MKEEVWRDIPGYEHLYQVSDQGRVKSLGNGKTHKSSRILKPITRRDYLGVLLYKSGNSKKHAIHLLVWETFNGTIPEGCEINHINENKQDNRLENLNLMTHKENINWGTGIRRRAKSRQKLVEQFTLDGTHIATWFSVKGIAEELGFHQSSISNCCLGKLKTAHGYIWKYEKEAV